jgi:hypothetical protein
MILPAVRLINSTKYLKLTAAAFSGQQEGAQPADGNELTDGEADKLHEVP